NRLSWIVDLPSFLANNPISMRLIVIFGVAATAAALSRSERKARYDALPDEKVDPNLELIFATSLWRHGDRAAANPIAGVDQFTEDDWTIGGGGYGQLSPEGMRQHFELGRKLRKRYVDDFKLLSPAYTAKEVYFRATDLNRTLISAYANAAGMYSGFGVEGQNYPSKTALPDWPTGYVPIPVHTIPYNKDHELHPDADCNRLQELYDLVDSSEEYQNYMKQPQVSQVLKYLSGYAGMELTPDDIYNFYDPMFCESLHIEELNQTGAKIEDFYPWFYTGDIPAMVDSIQAIDDDFSEGLGNPNGINGIDVSVEIPKIHAGDTLKLVVSNVNGILKCRTDSTSSDCRSFYNNLKYYAMSAHDSTVMSFLVILGAKKYVMTESVPAYSATVLLEVYEDKTTGEKSFKTFYHADENSGFKPFTGFVRGCDMTKDTCPVSVLDDLVAKYAPDKDMETLCNTPLFETPQDTTPLAPELTTEKTTSKTTPQTTAKPTTTTSSAPSFSILAAISVIFLANVL
ncbi:pho-4, partial [Pristionchus pacificus]